MAKAKAKAKSKPKTSRRIPRAKPTQSTAAAVVKGVGAAVKAAVRTAMKVGAYAATGAVGGALARHPLGQSVGGMIANKILGRGNYSMKKNTLFNARSSDQVPRIHNSQDGVIVTHTEYLADIQSSTAFTTQGTWALNPGLSDCFLWLSALAQNFEEYEWLGLIFEFKSTAGDAFASANNSMGEVVAAVDYNPINAAFTNKEQMLNTWWNCSTKPSCNMMIPVECAPKHNPLATLFVRTAAAPANTDLRLYDLGNFQIATQGSQGAYDVGELHVSYQVRLRKPIIQPLAGGGEPDVYSAHYQSSTSVSTSNYFGTSRTQKFDNFYGTLQNQLVFSATQITFPVGVTGTFALMLAYSGNSTASVTPPNIQFTTNAKQLTIGQNGTTSQDGTGQDTAPAAGTAETSTSAIVVAYFYILDPTTAAVLTAASGTLPASTYLNLLISQINGALTA